MLTLCQTYEIFLSLLYNGGRNNKGIETMKTIKNALKIATVAAAPLLAAAPAEACSGAFDFQTRAEAVDFRNRAAPLLHSAAQSGEISNCEDVRRLLQRNFPGYTAQEHRNGGTNASIPAENPDRTVADYYIKGSGNELRAVSDTVGYKDKRVGPVINRVPPTYYRTFD